MIQPAPSLTMEFPAAEEMSGWPWRLAYWISHLASPPVLGSVATLLAAHTLATPAAWLWATAYLLLVVAVPCLYIGWLVWRGQLADFHLPVREQRIRPLLCSVVVALLAWLLLTVMAAPPLLRGLAAANGVQTTLFLAITLRWKISLHCATAANLSVLACGLLGGAGAPLLATIPLIGWARVYLHRHTVAQSAAGAVLGTGILLLMLAIY
jgi:membrane-associated phospholipid phosphatase